MSSLEDCPFRDSTKRSKIFHPVVKEEKVQQEVSRKRFVGQSGQAAAFWQTSFPENDGARPWWSWSFVSRPALDEESEPLSFQSHLAELFS